VKEIEAFLSDFREKTSPDTGKRNSIAMTRRVFRTLGQILSLGVRRGKVTQNWAREVETPKARKRAKKELKAGRDFPTKEEMQAILDAARNNRRAYPLILTAAHTGLRVSEILGLRWENVDFDAAEIHVVERLDRFGEHGNPKSEDSNRTLPIPPTLLQALREWKLACPKGELVFPNSTGRPEFQGNVWRRVLLPVQERAGVARDGKVKYGMHAFRHYFCTMLIDAGAAPKRIQKMMGHSTLAMTMDTYGGLFKDGKLADLVARTFG
jgi:integrase